MIEKLKKGIAKEKIAWYNNKKYLKRKEKNDEKVI